MDGSPPNGVNPSLEASAGHIDVTPSEQGGASDRAMHGRAPPEASEQSGRLRGPRLDDEDLSVAELARGGELLDQGLHRARPLVVTIARRGHEVARRRRRAPANNGRHR